MNLDQLQRLWRETRAPEVAHLVDRRSPRLARPLFPKAASFELKRTRWLSLAKAVSGEVLATLLDALHDGDSDAVAERLALVATWPSDPRITLTVGRLWEQPSHLNVSTLHLWRELSRLTVARGDAHLLARLDALVALGPGWVGIFRPHMRPYIAPLLAQTRAALAEVVARQPARALTAEERARLLDAAPPPGKAEALAAVWAQPDALEPRLVYADMLSAEGDPRGEFIALQCAPARTPAQTRRMAALARAHGAGWAGPLGRVAVVDAFERGFPAELTLTARSRLAFGPLLGHPAWSTVHTVGVGPFVEPLLHPAMTRVLRVKDLGAPELRALGKHQHPFPFRSLVAPAVSAVAGFTALHDRARFPRLVEVQVLARPRPDERAAVERAVARLRAARPEVEVGVGPRKLAHPSRLRRDGR